MKDALKSLGISLLWQIALIEAVLFAAWRNSESMNLNLFWSLPLMVLIVLVVLIAAALVFVTIRAVWVERQPIRDAFSRAKEGRR